MDSDGPSIILRAHGAFNFPLALKYFRRRAGELVDAAEGDAYRRVLWIGGSPVLAEARELSDPSAQGLAVRLLAGDRAMLPAAGVALHRSFGLGDDLGELHRQVSGDAILAGLFEQRSGLRLVRTQSAFEALVWAVIGQQINLTFAFRLKSMLVRRYGESMDFDGRTYWGFPLPPRLAGADEAELAGTGLGRRKAATIVAVASAITAGELDLEGLAAERREEAERRLVALSGVGPWTAHYTLLRGLGDFGAFPASDLGLRVAVGRLYNNGETAPMAQMKELALRWGEWRGYAAFYLWNSLAERAA